MIHCISRLQLKSILEKCNVYKLKLYTEILVVKGIGEFLNKRKYICHNDNKSWISIEIIGGTGYMSEYNSFESIYVLLTCPYEGE